MTESVLITGAEGFIGCALASRLLTEGEQVLRFSRSLGHDLRAEDPFRDFRSRDIRLVIHTAALSESAESWEQPTLYYEINALGTQKVAEFCLQKGAGLVYLSTYVYGAPQSLPVGETHPVAPHNPYAHSKWLGEEVTRFYAGRFNLKTAVVRPFNIYGPGQSERFLISQIVHQWVRDGKIVVDNLKPRRDFLYIDDFIKALIIIVRQGLHGEIYNVGSGTSYSVAQVIELLEELVGARISTECANRERPGDIADVKARCRLSEEGLWKPATSLKEGLTYVLRAVREKR